MMRTIVAALLACGWVSLAAAASPPTPPNEFGHAGSHEASANVYCQPGTKTLKNNYVRACRMAWDQKFTKVTFRNPGQPPVTIDVTCRTGRMVQFDQYGHVTNCP